MHLEAERVVRACSPAYSAAAEAPRGRGEREGEEGEEGGWEGGTEAGGAALGKEEGWVAVGEQGETGWGEAG